MKLNSGFEDEFGGNGVNLIPLLDVIFLLLIFFFYAVLKMQVVKSVKIELPSVESSQTSQAIVKPVVIGLDNSHQLWIGDRIASIEQIKVFLGGLNKETQLLVRVDKDASFGKGLNLLEITRNQGLSQVQIQVHEESIKP